jgi:ABC-type multidrug transport system ATPase subunit
MEEAEVLCDRLGIFVNGRLVCIGNPKQLTARYGGYYVRACLCTLAASFSLCSG